MRRCHTSYNAPLSGRSRLDVPQKGAGEPDPFPPSDIPATQASTSTAMRDLKEESTNLRTVWLQTRATRQAFQISKSNSTRLVSAHLEGEPAWLTIPT